MTEAKWAHSTPVPKPLRPRTWSAGVVPAAVHWIIHPRKLTGCAGSWTREDCVTWPPEDLTEGRTGVPAWLLQHVGKLHFSCPETYFPHTQYATFCRDVRKGHLSPPPLKLPRGLALSSPLPTPTFSWGINGGGGIPLLPWPLLFLPLWALIFNTSLTPDSLFRHAYSSQGSLCLRLPAAMNELSHLVLPHLNQ